MKLQAVNSSIQNIGKRFNREWIFRNVNLEFAIEDSVAILGGNGSGKSTLLQIISGYLTPSEGIVLWRLDGNEIAVENIHRHVSICAPYMQVYEDLTLKENVEFFCKFKKIRGALSAELFASRIELEKQLDKPLKNFSSGMRQRVKLGLAILAQSDLLLLDEPTSHLDSDAVKWFQKLLEENAGDRIVFIASNSNINEMGSCNSRIEIQNFKT